MPRMSFINEQPLQLPQQERMDRFLLLRLVIFFYHHFYRVNHLIFCARH